MQRGNNIFPDDTIINTITNRNTLLNSLHSVVNSVDSVTLDQFKLEEYLKLMPKGEPPTYFKNVKDSVVLTKHRSLKKDNSKSDPSSTRIFPASGSSKARRKCVHFSDTVTDNHFQSASRISSTF